ncbi:MAG TPA: hypothetical protein VM451_08110 [Candidatus Limnocylindria bacterium]|nr:hypothetical protein [Candidatus Limnocylindria bacterium]
MVETRGSFAGPWLVGFALGAANGTLYLSLAMLMLPLIAASLVLLLWRAPRLASFVGFVAGWGFMWVVLFSRLALTCGGPLDFGARECDAGELAPWFMVAGAILAAGLLETVAVRRSR